MLEISLWHRFHPGVVGIPQFLYWFVTIPMLGILVVPFFVLVETITLRKGYRT